MENLNQREFLEANFQHSKLETHIKSMGMNSCDVSFARKYIKCDIGLAI